MAMKGNERERERGRGRGREQEQEQEQRGTIKRDVRSSMEWGWGKPPL